MIYEKKLIDADKLKDDVWKYALTCKNTSFEFTRRMSDIEKIIDEQPKLDVPDICVGKWIPCSERLPKQNEHIIGTFKNINAGINLVFGVNFYYDLLNEPIPMIAWMPLPEPYKEK